MLTWLDGPDYQLTCRVCGDTRPKPARVSAPHVAFPDQAATFVACDACQSLSYVDDILAFEHIQDGDINLFLRQYLESTAGIWEMLWPVAILDGASRKSLLDVGCGFGFTADAWKHSMNDDAHGCDPAEYAAAGRALLGEHIHHAMLEDVPELASRRFDIVYASEVIEHVPDPRAFVGLLASKVSANGVIALTTPAADFIDRRSDPSTTRAALAPGFHGFLFSRVALESLLRTAGFSHVVVERHSERLIAWASNVPIVRQPQATLADRYLNYLRGRCVAEESEANVQTADAALHSGYVYRYYKECVLRGLTHDLSDVRARALKLVFPDTKVRDSGATPDEVRVALETCSGGVSEFGRRFRFNLPQLAFILGIHSQLFENDVATAEKWYGVCQLATEKLCGASVLHGLEAVAFYWQADAQLLLIELSRGRVDAASERYLRMVRALETPDQRTGGSSPGAELVVGLLTQFWRVAHSSRSSHIAELFENSRVVTPQLSVRDPGWIGFAASYLGTAARGFDQSEIAQLRAILRGLSDRTETLGALAKRLVDELAALLRPQSFASLAAQPSRTR